VVAKADGTVIQKNHYYPFGIAFAENTVTEQGKQPYKYNGKELDQMHGLNMYDYSARFYEPGIGRFSTVDPHAENYYGWSPYAYVGNNPIKRTDPTGMDWFVNGENGNVYFIRNLTTLAKLTDGEAKFLGIDRNNISHYENLGGDDLINLEGNPYYHVVNNNPENFMRQKGFAAVDRVRIKEVITEYKYTEADNSYRTVSSTTESREIARCKSYTKEGRMYEKDLGNGKTQLSFDLPDLYKGKEISSKPRYSFKPIIETVNIIDYKVPKGGSYIPPAISETEKSTFVDNFIILFLSIFNAYMDNRK
jgi:RHS repeat-associated protein